MQVNIEVMGAFVRIRQMLQSNTALAKKRAALDQEYDGQFRVVFDATRELMTPPGTAKKRIRFRSEGD